MHVKWDYLNFSSFDLQVKATEILKYILSFSGKKHDQRRGTNYQILGKY